VANLFLRRIQFTGAWMEPVTVHHAQ